ncbi:DNA-packaging protein [Pseudogemmobacter humi]|uniref:Terminase-like family protein n=1 Tax=Pseudogemmobacter humi TaxID=2483812 RepID=A0A3P5XB54_9RHOB|nr:terminase family protein [Pseudogemmobacter humi]VDC31792.1 Terminase-like family protein [Pseudogemmobacter humi]
MRSGAAWLACALPEEIDEFLGALGDNALRALPWLFEFWALPHQLAPEGAWKTWVIMGGRGAGKTRAGAEWVRAMVEGATPAAPGRARRVALVAETLEQAREVMVLGESGILACSPPDRRPGWIASRNRLEWENGAVAQLFSAHDPERLRGPQFDAAWSDELAKWPKAAETWDQLQFGLRLGEHPQQVVTTTPRNVAVLKAILQNPSTVVTHAPTEANRAWLAESFLAEIQARYGGTALGRQEIEGVLVEEAEGALWTPAMIRAAQGAVAVRPGRVVVAVDPPVTATKRSDECGILVVGADTEGPPGEWKAVVLADRSVRGASPDGWARAALAAMEEFSAERLVVEVNQGGDLVAGVVRQVDPLVPVREVRATKGKMLRAEPVAALYEQGRVAHTRGLGDLEAQMVQMTRTGWQGQGSPDRLDALVWALTELMILPSGRIGRPGVRTI